MEPYFLSQGAQIRSTHLYLNQYLPEIDEFDWLIVMGGPMGVSDELKYPWITLEKKFIEQAIESGKIVLGICLGAQLIAEVSGARVFKNKDREIGWFPIIKNSCKIENRIIKAMPASMDAFHWHGETFDLPAGSTLVGSSEACINQGFIMDNKAVGFQFHLETTESSAKALIKNCRRDLDGSRYVQTESEMLSDPVRFKKINTVMNNILQELAQTQTTV